MASDKPDRVDRRLLRPTLDDLIEKPLEALGNASCRDQLDELMQEEWRLLAERSCVRNNRSVPNERDALNAFDAIKHSIQEDHGDRDSLLSDPAALSKLTAPEIWSVLQRLTVKHWIGVFSAVIGLLTAAFSAGIWYSNF